MRLLIDCRMARWFGIGRYTRSLVGALSRRRDLELVLAVSARQGALEGLPGPAEVRRMHCPPLLPGAGLELAALVARVRPDVVHCTHFPTPLPAGGRPLVVTLHDLIPLLEPDSMPSALRRALYRAVNLRAARVARRIVAPSRATADDLEALLPGARGKVRVVHEAADDFSKGEVGAVPPAVAGTQRYLLGMASTRSHKELRTLLRAFATLAPRYPDLALLLAGEGSRAWLDGELPQDLPVRFTGPVDDAGLRALYRGAAAFVFPSRREGFGLPILEAMALGAPVLCASTPAALEVAGQAALHFETGNPAALAEALDHLLGQESLRSRLVTAGLERAAAFSWDRAAEETVSVYREALAGDRG